MSDVGVFRAGVRVGTIAHFTDGRKHRFWCAYSYGGAREKFKTRKAALAWIIEREEALALSSPDRALARAALKKDAGE